MDCKESVERRILDIAPRFRRLAPRMWILRYKRDLSEDRTDLRIYIVRVNAALLWVIGLQRDTVKG